MFLLVLNLVQPIPADMRQTLVVQKLTESKFGIPIEIRSLMSAGIGCILYTSMYSPAEAATVTLKRIGFFCFPIKHSTHTRLGDLKENWFLLFSN